IDAFDVSNFNCLTGETGSCAWYQIGGVDKSSNFLSIDGKFAPLTPGKYIIIVSGGPTNAKERFCSNNPYVTYPITTGGFTFADCGSPAIHLTVTGNSAQPSQSPHTSSPQASLTGPTTARVGQPISYVSSVQNNSGGE